MSAKRKAQERPTEAYARMVQWINDGRPQGDTPKEQEVAADWGWLPEPLLGAVVVAVTRSGGAVLFGKTRDGYCLALTVMCADKRITRYARPEEVETIMLPCLQSLLWEVDAPA